MKAILKRELESPDIYKLVASGTSAQITGVECAKQHISWRGKEKDCFMLVYGAHDDFARRIFLLDEDRKLFVEEKKKEESSEIDLDDDEDIAMD